ncbi:MAG: S-methyl-5-thioribose-1-phosphate isomerase, partial [bacterium]
PLRWSKGTLQVLDQLRLPHSVKTVACRSFKDTGETIRTMRVRGAPAIGVAAAYGMAQATLASKARNAAGLIHDLEKAAVWLKATRPTAVNLAWAVDRVLAVARNGRERALPELKDLLVGEAQSIEQEDVRLCAALAGHGSALLRDKDRVLTHCNTGALATAGVGTALGCITTAARQGKKLRIWVDETRPYLQGARLTALELKEAKIPHTLITDSSAGALMAAGKVDVVIVGADRVTARGDVANKIGTYTLAVLAKHHALPFYVAAPSSTVDLSLSEGTSIPIEQRSPEEVLFVQGKSIAPKGTQALHLAFDVTPHALISAIITEKGVVRAPYDRNLAGLLGQSPF